MVVCLEMKTLWTLHAAILEDPPVVTVVRQLARLLANIGVEEAAVEDVVCANPAGCQRNNIV